MCHWVTIDDFNALAKDDKAAIKDAYVFLQKSKKAIDPLQLNERWAEASKVGGGYILRWLIDQKRQDFAHEFANLLCWFIHPEGLDSQLTTWLATATQVEPTTHDKVQLSKWQPTTDGKAQLAKWQWARHLYGSIVQAHLAWSFNGTASPAIKRLRDDVDSIANLHRIIGTVSAITVLLKELLSDNSKPCDVKL